MPKVWRLIKNRTILVNALLKITADCDCLPGYNPEITRDSGFLGGCHPVTLDGESLKLMCAEPFDSTHPGVPWERQFEYAGENGFLRRIKNSLLTKVNFMVYYANGEGRSGKVGRGLPEHRKVRREL